MAIPKIVAYPLPTGQEIPSARMSWTFDPGCAAVLIHDMQNYFLSPFEADASPIAPVIANIVRLKRCAHAAGMPVFYTAQNGNQDPRDRGLQADLWGPGMTDAPGHQNIVEALKPGEEDIVLVKHRYSAYQMSNLAHHMQARGRSQLVICGVYAHIGCLLTAAEAFQRDVKPFLVADALADFSRERHDMALAYAAMTCAVPLTLDALSRSLPQGEAS
ncbi:isochorismatase family protein [Rhizobium sp. CG5]|uniref:isochorismatase family protein n=1 Tax=Rhizobium sp. CG5 TaxID=2726076 RepID=UPI0020346253|nr:isochorismatase family protein [Rhizobium sp. CG5]MCM2476482.1 isochorismatase family protein [Rhizobium sp. CG5]